LSIVILYIFTEHVSGLTNAVIDDTTLLAINITVHICICKRKKDTFGSYHKYIKSEIF
jgi:hypothetical protein